MVKIYKQPFAHDGDAIAIPDTSQPDGKMSSVDGWTPDYQLPKADPNYKPVGRQEMNGVFKEVTEALGQVQVRGSAVWSADGAPYPVNAQVYHNGKQWIALRANSVAPTEGEDWSAVMSQKAVTDALSTKANTSTQVIAGTGLSGGGTLAANRTLSVSYGTTEGTAAQGNDPRIVGAAAKTYVDDVIANSKAYVDNQLIGMSQSRKYVTRHLGTTYTNTTGRTIVICGWAAKSNAGANERTVLRVHWGGDVIMQSISERGGPDAATARAASSSLTLVVPSGDNYMWDGDPDGNDPGVDFVFWELS